MAIEIDMVLKKIPNLEIVTMWEIEDVIIRGAIFILIKEAMWDIEEVIILPLMIILAMAEEWAMEKVTVRGNAFILTKLIT